GLPAVRQGPRIRKPPLRTTEKPNRAGLQHEGNGFAHRSWRLLRGVPARAPKVNSDRLANGAEAAEARKEFVGAGDVAGDLRAQFFRSIELLLVAKAFPKPHFDSLWWRKELRIQKVRLDAERGCIKRGAHPDVGDRAAAALLAVQAGPRNINTAPGEQILIACLLVPEAKVFPHKKCLDTQVAQEDSLDELIRSEARQFQGERKHDGGLQSERVEPRQALRDGRDLRRSRLWAKNFSRR